MVRRARVRRAGVLLAAWLGLPGAVFPAGLDTHAGPDHAAAVDEVPQVQKPVPQDQKPPADPETARRRGWDDKRRTLRSYGSNMIYNFAGVVTTGNHTPLAVTTVLTAPALAWDDEFIDYFRRHPHNRFGEIGAKLGGGIAVGGLSLGVFAAGRIARGGRFRATSYDLSQAILVTQVYTHALKFSFQRHRPDGSDRLSFPSGHASNAFTSATVIARHYGLRLAIPGYAVATYIATSRMAARKHHLSDIVAGAGFGFGVGRAVVRRNGRPPDEPGTKDIKVYLGPDPGPAGDGHGLSLTLSF